VAAVVGLVFAVGIGLAASTLASERIGLSSEPLTAGGELAPAAVKRAPQARPKPDRKPSAPTSPAPAPPATPAPAPASPAAPQPEQEHELEPDGDRDD
jgi:hypothetical protein